MSRAAIVTVPAAWNAPAGVRALTTCRLGGVSRGPYDSLNLADHVEDDPADVAENRARLRSLGVGAEPVWLGQVHGARVIDAVTGGARGADGSFTDRRGVVCAVLTADCLPLFLCDRDGQRVAVLHVGWRGLVSGVIEAGVAAVGIEPHGLLAWLGPAIGPRAFEIGSEVKTALAGRDPQARACFTPSSRTDRWFADLYRLAALRLARLGVHDCAWDASLCTVRDARRFFSYRRNPRCGRMASLIWME